MRFGAFLPQGWRLDLVGIDTTDHWSTMVDVAQTIERSGFESLWVYDHFHTYPVPTQEVTYEAWTLMAALATITETVRLGQMCTCNSYRPPSYLAKVAASIDVISGGRVEMGIGAGWYEHEYGYGYEFPKPSLRIGMLREGVEIMQRMWTEDEVHFRGEHYTLEGAICQPKPIQEPHIPFWVAGGGEQLTLRVAAKHAAYTNFGGDVDTFTHKSEILKGHCDEIGRDFDSITRSSNFEVLLCGDSEAELADKLGQLKDRYRPFLGDERVEKLAASWGMIGTPEQLIERFRPWAKAGMDYAIIYFGDAAYDRSGIELFASEVIPALAD